MKLRAYPNPCIFAEGNRTISENSALRRDFDTRPHTYTRSRI